MSGKKPAAAAKGGKAAPATKAASAAKSARVGARTKSVRVHNKVHFYKPKTLIKARAPKYTRSLPQRRKMDKVCTRLEGRGRRAVVISMT